MKTYPCWISKRTLKSLDPPYSKRNFFLQISLIKPLDYQEHTCSNWCIISQDGIKRILKNSKFQSKRRSITEDNFYKWHWISLHWWTSSHFMRLCTNFFFYEMYNHKRATNFLKHTSWPIRYEESLESSQDKQHPSIHR